MADPRRALPSVNRLLEDPGIQALLATAPRNLVVAAVREAVASARDGGPIPDDWTVDVAERVERHTAPSLHTVFNATGVVLHTNLGRAPLARTALDAIRAVAEGYSTLELDTATGTRGSRADHCAGLLASLTATEDALVVNNAAGALLLALNVVAAGKEVLISRGELIEIGGSFRIPEILEKSGATLREVGTTNRTHLADYRTAIGPQLGAVLTVHRSNFQQTGFVVTPPPSELARLAQAAGVPYLYDIGSGLLIDLSRFGLASEPRVADAVAAGADLICFSGDKLLGGPQAGCLVGKTELIAHAKRNPLARALRADKMTLAGLEATLALYHDPERALRDIPVLRMLTMSQEEIQDRAARLQQAIESTAESRAPSADRRAAEPPSHRAVLRPGTSAVGGGSFPEAKLPTMLVAIDPGPLGAAGLALRLRLGKPPVIARIENELVVLDPRTIPDGALGTIAKAVSLALEQS
ncbi:MAG: L-seryl-tRNA(Sec) selenium transferase [Gemmatimonadales bacterium]